MIKIATAIMIMQDNLFITTNNLPDLSILPTDLPNKAKKINQIHETNIHVKVKSEFVISLSGRLLVPITPIVSIIACGFNKETDKASIPHLRMFVLNKLS